MGYQKVIINLPEDEHKEVIKIAEEEMRTIGSVGRKALFEYIKRIKEKKNGEKPHAK